jgi:hypothetical protein
MSEQRRPGGERPEVEKVEIFVELAPSPRGTSQYTREDDTVVHGDASGEWTLDEDGEVEDIVFFMSPRYVRSLRARQLLDEVDE